MFRKQKQNTQPAVFSKKWIYGRRIQALEQLIEERYRIADTVAERQRFWTLIDLRAHLIRELECCINEPQTPETPPE